MYQWIRGNPVVLVNDEHLARWPGGDVLDKKLARVAALGDFLGGSVLVLREPHPTTVVPLELGGVLLVTAASCDERRLSAHLDALPFMEWELLPKPFRTAGGSHSIFDASLRGKDLIDPAQRAAIREKTGGALRVSLEPGDYDVECVGPYQPSDGSSLFMTRLIRRAPSQEIDLGSQ